MFAIADEAEQLYEAVCTIGLHEVEVCYEENDKTKIKQASEIYPYYRAIAVVIMYLKGFELKRLEKIFNLPNLNHPKGQGIALIFDEEEMRFIKECHCSRRQLNRTETTLTWCMKLCLNSEYRWIIQ